MIRIRLRYQRLAASLRLPYWIICGVVDAAVVLKLVARQGFHFEIGNP
jgi:hypothetical protein